MIFDLSLRKKVEFIKVEKGMKGTCDISKEYGILPVDIIKGQWQNWGTNKCVRSGHFPEVDKFI